jgi:hypothetical protein
MRWEWSLFFFCACAGPRRVATLPPDQAAAIARRYDDAGLCQTAWWFVGGAAVAVSGVGIGLFVRGILPTNLTLVPNASTRSEGFSARLAF